MTEPKPRYIQPAPTKKRVLLFSFLWLVGTTLLVLSMTDLFTESIFKKKYAVLYILIIANTFFVLKMWRTYLKNNKA